MIERYWRAQHFQPDRGDACLPDVRLLGRGQREIDNSSFHKGTAIGDSNDGRMTGLEVGDSHRRSQRKSAGGRRSVDSCHRSGHSSCGGCDTAPRTSWPCRFRRKEVLSLREQRGRSRRRPPFPVSVHADDGVASGRFGAAGLGGGTEAVAGAAMGGGGGGLTFACFLPPQPLSMSPASTSARMPGGQMAS